MKVVFDHEILSFYVFYLVIKPKYFSEQITLI